MEEILHHLGCIKHPKIMGINYQPRLVSRISEPSTVFWTFWAHVISIVLGGTVHVESFVLFFPSGKSSFSVHFLHGYMSCYRL